MGLVSDFAVGGDDCYLFGVGLGSRRGLLHTQADWDHVIVGVIDADGDLEPRSLSVIVDPEYFGRPEVRAVQIKVRVGNDPGTTVPYRTQLLNELQGLGFSSVMAACRGYGGARLAT
ncbi:MAG: hypothetical protein ACRDZ8_04585 [Acidimicrobiales bacterium]